MASEDDRKGEVDTKEEGEVDVPKEGGDVTPQVQETQRVFLEHREEAKLKDKYPHLKGSGGSALLHKRLTKGQKYFDSGDYNMAKAKMNNPKKPLAPSEKLFLQESIGEAIPTPENLPTRKTSIVTSKLASGAALS